MIIGGHSQSFIQHPQKTGNTIIYQSSFRNQYVGLIDLATFPSEDSYKLVGLDAAYDSPSEMPGPVDLAVTHFKAAIAAMNSAEDLASAKTNGPSHYQTFPRCAECHLKQFNFWRTTAHATALAPLVKAHQDKNKECLQCHTVGLGKPGGFNNVNALAEISTGQESSTPISNERFVDYMASLHDGKNLSSIVRGISSADLSVSGASPSPEPTSNTELTINQSLGHIKMAWTPVQCENCHGAGADHPISGEIKKKVDTQVCLTCHTSDRAPEWYKADGKPDWEKIRAKHAQISCPAGDMSAE
jgi:mono/diheme cytochrome c family protein